MSISTTLPRLAFQLILLSILWSLVARYEAHAQLRRQVLFLGNSYTGVNNLPQLIQDAALSAGDTLVFDSYTPGGYQLVNHNQDINSQNKIMAGGWDYVVIQGQSQEPVIAYNQFTNGGIALHHKIKEYNPCAVTMPYMTWGRKNGDLSNCAAFPVMCTYQRMDSTLKEHYLNLTNTIRGEVSPVSVVWNYLRQHYPNIELYQPDESHPSTAGTYAAACCFYAAIFKKDPSLISIDFGLNATDASIIRAVARTQVFDSLHIWDYKQLPVSDFSYQAGAGMGNEVSFTSINQGAWQYYLWDFGDGDTASIPNPTHTYQTDGSYTVSLTTTNCDGQGWHISYTDTVIQFCGHTPIVYTKLPWLCQYDTLWTQVADAYQWYVYGAPIPETSQYVAHYAQYGISGFSVMVTLNGCTELSAILTATPQWSGYYFDAIGNPCAGDTVSFAVLHTDGFLSGLETILWYKNDTLLPLMTNEDTLLIFSSGAYECKVVNPHTACPLDTTTSLIAFDCGMVGVSDKYTESGWTIFPNPASEAITIKPANPVMQEQVYIYNAIGRLTKTLVISGETTVDIADLPNGLYLIRLKNNTRHPVKFIKQ